MQGACSAAADRTAFSCRLRQHSTALQCAVCRCSAAGGLLHSIIAILLCTSETRADQGKDKEPAETLLCIVQVIVGHKIVMCNVFTLFLIMTTI